MKQQTSFRRTFLFLQGPHGSFFPKLGAALAAKGHRVRRINLNGGDRATWRRATNFSGRARSWPHFIKHYLMREGVTDLVLFGDCRWHHARAISAARTAGVRVHVFEEGYIRPDWVTLERDGVNGHSTLPRDPAWFVREARGLPPVPTFPPLPFYGAARGWAAFFYYAEVVLQHWRFPFHGSHRSRNPVWEGIRFLRRFAHVEEEQARAAVAAARLAGAPYMLFPLQLNSDYQIRVHSPFGSMHAAIDMVLGSFARHAPADLKLAVKEHPLDSGLNDWNAVVDAAAVRLGIADRVAFLAQGDLSALVDRSIGMVTVNSTSGTLALAANKPVKVLGSAVYDVPGITDQQPLEGFWSGPVAPDAAIYDAFYRVLADRCLIHGAFLNNTGIDLLVKVATERLTLADPVFVAAGPSHH